MLLPKTRVKQKVKEIEDSCTALIKVNYAFINENEEQKKKILDCNETMSSQVILPSTWLTYIHS